MANPLVPLLRDREMGRILALVLPLTRGITKDSPLKLLFLIGLAALWNRRLLGNRYPRISDVIEHAGAVCVILAFFGLLGLYFPPHLVWVSGVCCAVSVVSILLNYLPTGEDNMYQRLPPPNAPVPAVSQ